jgi:hypothetical protein
MEQSPSWEANRFGASQEIPHILWNLKVHYCSHKCPPPVPILSQLDPVHTPHPTSLISILILSSHLCLGLPSGLFPFLSPIRATCPTHPNLLNFITWTILGEKYRSLSYSLYSFLHSSHLVPLRPKYSQHPILRHPQPMFLPQYQRPSFTPIENKRAKL